jgi:hypothetical protein
MTDSDVISVAREFIAAVEKTKQGSGMHGHAEIVYTFEDRFRKALEQASSITEEMLDKAYKAGYKHGVAVGHEQQLLSAAPLNEED